MSNKQDYMDNLGDELATTERFCDYMSELDKYHEEQEKKQNRKIPIKEITKDFDKQWFTLERFKKYFSMPRFKVTFYDDNKNAICSKVYDLNKIKEGDLK